MLKSIKNSWNGNEKLWKVFWIWNFLLLNIFDVLAVIIFFMAIFPVQFYWVARNDPSVSVGYPLTAAKISFALFGVCFLIFILAYTVWALVSLWCSAFNSSRRIYGYLARFWVIVQLCFAIVFPMLGSIYPDSIFNIEDDITIESVEYQNNSS